MPLRETESTTIAIADSDDEIGACLSVMKDLREIDAEAAFLERVRYQQRSGYRLALLRVEGRPVAVAGFRIGENLAWGRFLYVDDLVTAADSRSTGSGKALLDWLKSHARSEGCRELHLDSGTRRLDAHRFYRREGLDVSSLHFKVDL